MPVIYCQNNLGGAWERDQSGKWPKRLHARRRAHGAMLFIGIILPVRDDGNYKEDLITFPFIRRGSPVNPCRISTSSAPANLANVLEAVASSLCGPQFIGLRQRLRSASEFMTFLRAVVYPA